MAVKKLRAVEVDWIDSIQTQGWMDFKKSDLRCKSAGYLVEKSQDRIVLALNKSAYCFGHYIEIPASAVKRIRRLK